MTDTRLQELYQAGIAARPRTGCVGEEQILALVEHKGTEAERLGTLDHVMACEKCRKEFELLRTLSEGHESLQRRSQRSWISMRRWLPMAAVVALAIGAYSVWRPDDRTPVFRGNGDSLVVISPLERSFLGPQRFVWHSVPGSVAYQLDVLRADGTVLAAAETRDTVVELSDQWVDNPGSYRWWVTARMLDGSTRQSAVVTVDLEPLER